MSNNFENKNLPDGSLQHVKNIIECVKVKRKVLIVTKVWWLKDRQVGEEGVHSRVNEKKKDLTRYGRNIYEVNDVRT